MVIDPFIEDISIFFGGVVAFLVVLLFGMEVAQPESTPLAGFVNFWRGFFPDPLPVDLEPDARPAERRRRADRGRTQIREEERGDADEAPASPAAPAPDAPTEGVEVPAEPPEPPAPAAPVAAPVASPVTAPAAPVASPAAAAAPAPPPPRPAVPPPSAPRAPLPERKPGGISADASIAKALERMGIRAPVGASRKAGEQPPAPLDEVLQRLGVLLGTLDQAREVLKVPRISWVDSSPNRVFFPEEGGVKLELDAAERNAKGERLRPFSTVEGAANEERERIALVRLGAAWLGSPLDGDSASALREQAAARGAPELSRLVRLMLPEEGPVDALDAVAERAVELLPLEVSPDGVRIRAAGALSTRRLTVTRSAKRIRVFAGTEIAPMEGQALTWADSPPQDKPGTVWYYTLWYNPRNGGPARAVADLTVNVE
jgi:hypothetical protein